MWRLKHISSCIFLARECVIHIASYLCLWFSQILGFRYMQMQALDPGSHRMCLPRLSKLFFPLLLVLLKNVALLGLSWSWKAKWGESLKDCSECFSSPAGRRYYLSPHEKDYSNKMFTLASWTKRYKQVLSKYPNLCLLSQTQTLKLLMQHY